MRIRKRVASVACVGALAAAAVLPLTGHAGAQSAEWERSASNVTIRYNADVAKFKGTVGSRHRCQRFRKIYVKKHVPGKNRVVAKDTTNREGNWKVHRRNQPGRYYAMVTPKTVRARDGHRIRCLWDRSPTIKN